MSHRFRIDGAFGATSLRRHMQTSTLCSAMRLATVYKSPAAESRRLRLAGPLADMSKMTYPGECRHVTNRLSG
jgi:hypothetical protein